MVLKDYKEDLYYFLIHIILFFILYSSNLIMLGINDDLALFWLLSLGYSSTLILSYPVSSILSVSYTYLPSVQWLSLFYFVLLFSNIALSYFYLIKNEKERFLKNTLILISVIFFTFVWQNINITMLTLITYASALLALKYNLKLSFFLLFITLLLRNDIAILCLPFFIVSLFILYRNILMSKRNLFFLTATIIIPIFLNNYLIKKDTAYYEWLKFNSARAFFTDLKADTKNSTFTNEEKSIAQSWYPQDEYLLSSEKMIQNEYSKIGLYIEQIQQYDIKKLFKHNFNFLFILLFFSGLFFVYSKSRKIDLLLYLSFSLGFLLVLILRDVSRVTVPLIFLWFILVFLLINKTISNENKLKTNVIRKNIFTFLFLILLLLSLPISYNTPKMILSDKIEKISFLENHKFKCEPSVNFPQRWDGGSGLLNYNLLFNEKDWINSNQLLSAGWLSRHPFFYKTHNISAHGQERKYNSFYDWLISEESCFIGGGIIENNFSKMVLDMYDLKLKDKSCKHKVKIIDSYKDLKVTKIYINCKEEK
ncbi:hypothetical protein NG752_10310 [Aliarcobacter cryaerophilus]|uniref:hypothetical protein n=1 Tax=Aliarcobacter cryaerophilus TaxID=28198 RepID=UPI003DA4CE3B